MIRLLQGDSLAMLATLESESVQCAMARTRLNEDAGLFAEVE